MPKVVGVKKLVPDRVEFTFKEFFKVLEDNEGFVEDFSVICGKYKVCVSFMLDEKEINYEKGTISFGFNPSRGYTLEDMFVEIDKS